LKHQRIQFIIEIANSLTKNQGDFVLFREFAQRTITKLPIRAKTRANYRSMLNCHIDPIIGSCYIREIQRVDIQHCIQGLPPQTAAMTLAVIKTVMREAVAQGILEVSPAIGVRHPQVIVSPRKFLTWDEIQSRDFQGYAHHVKFLALHGLRWGEAVALTQEDIRDGRIFVTKSVHGQTKSRAGVRMVPLLMPFLEFPKSPKTLRKALSPHGVTIHSLRHSYAYLLKQQGVHVTTAQRLLGHSDPRVTMAIYTQVLDNEIDEAGSMLSQALNLDRKSA
jgi:integrase